MPEVAARCDVPVFRFLFDRFSEYVIRATPSEWSITDPAGRFISSSEVGAVWFWKAFNFPWTDDSFLLEESKYLVREIYEDAAQRGIRKGNPPDFHNRFGKLFCLKVARNYFVIPNTVMLLNSDDFEPCTDSIVVKSLASGTFSGDKALFTSKVSPNELDYRYQWYLQDLVEASHDVTIFVCGTKLFAFERSRHSLRGLDWRAEQSLDPKIIEWNRIRLPPFFENSVRCFINELKVDWGRLDFLKSFENEFVFLEFNANGQWMFLDFMNNHDLRGEVARYLQSGI